MPRVLLLVLLLLAPVSRGLWAVAAPLAQPDATTMPCGMPIETGPVLYPDAPCCPLCTPATCPCLLAPELPQAPAQDPMTPSPAEHWRVLDSLALRTIVATLPAPPKSQTYHARATAQSRLAELDPQSFLCVRTT